MMTRVILAIAALCDRFVRARRRLDCQPVSYHPATDLDPLARSALIGISSIDFRKDPTRTA
jgi:hypothetical protein